MPGRGGRPQAVVFDLDGTLADNMSWHARAFDTFVRRHGLPPLTMDMRRRIDGKVNAEIMPILFGRLLTAADIDAYADEKEGTYRALSKGGVRPTAGAPRLLDRLAALGIPTAVATSAPAANVRHTLDELGLADRFAVIARSDEVARGKPAPDVYLRAAAALGVAAGACLAFEDAPVGVAAARSAGMRCLAITTTFPAETFLAAEWPPHGTHPDFDAYLDGEGRWLL
jgi:HAD superfamily hydrolase (TIGR01509 family)